MVLGLLFDNNAIIIMIITVSTSFCLVIKACDNGYVCHLYGLFIMALMEDENAIILR